MRNRVAIRGWTVIEVLVCLFLASIVLVMVSTVLRQGSRFAQMQSAATAQQTSLRLSLRHLERVLKASSPGGVSWLDEPAAAILCAHPFKHGDFTSGPSWEASWQCFVWDKSKSELRFLDSANLLPPVTETEPTAATPAQLSSVIQGFAAHPNRKLADRVSQFSYSLQPGSFYQLELELELPRSGTQSESGPGRIRASRKFIPRN